MLVQFIQKLLHGGDLSQEDTFQAFNAIMGGECEPIQIGSLLTALAMRGETVAEITGAAQAMIGKSAFGNVKDLLGAVDIVGTGGDSLGTFNISTTAAFVASGAGVPIAKHGNRGVTSKSGAADVLSALGVNLNVPLEQMVESVKVNGIGFLFAQKAHPSMAQAAPVRKALRMRTIFNLLGPLTNPMGARRHAIGVFAPMYTETFCQVLQQLGSTDAMVFCGEGGLDEISVTGPTRLSMLRDGKITTTVLNPEELVGRKGTLEQLKGGTPEDNARITRDILELRETGVKQDVVLLNAAAAIVAGGKADSLQEALPLARKSLESGAACKKLQLLVEASA